MYHRPWDPIPGVPCGAKPPEEPEGEPSCPKGGERCLSCGWCNCACSCKPKPPEPERIAHFSYCVHGYKRDEGCRECPSLPEHPPEERVGECPNGCNASEALRTCPDHGLPQFRKKVPGAQQTEPHSECRGGPEGLTDPAGGVSSAPTGTDPAGFEEWHAKNCPHLDPIPGLEHQTGGRVCDGTRHACVTTEDWPLDHAFIGRTCREVWSEEHPPKEAARGEPLTVGWRCMHGEYPVCRECFPAWEKRIRVIPPPVPEGPRKHGTCCTCRDCGKHHEDCRCDEEAPPMGESTPLSKIAPPAPEPMGGAGDEDYGMAPGACGTFRDIPEGPCFCGRNASMKHYRVHLTDACYPTIESWKAARDTVPGASRTPRVSDREPGRGVAVQPPPEGDGLPTPTGTTPSAAGRLAEAVCDAAAFFDSNGVCTEEQWREAATALIRAAIALRAERAGRGEGASQPGVPTP